MNVATHRDPTQPHPWRWLAIAVSVPLAGVGLIGFAHTDAGRPLLRYLPGMGACPLGDVQKLSAQELDAARAQSVASLRGERPTPTLSASHFVLGHDRRVDIDAWATQHGVTCKAGRGQNVVCEDAPLTALGQPEADGVADRVAFSFDANDRLVAVDITRSDLTTAEAAQWASVRVATLDTHLGESTLQGDLSEAFLRSGRLRRAEATYSFSDYRVQVTATHFDNGRTSTRETHQLLRPVSAT